MKNYKEIKFVDDELDCLNQQLEELLGKSEKILGYKSYDIDDVVNNLYHQKNNLATSLANDILDNRDEFASISENYLDNDTEDNPFNNLKDEDED